MVDGSNRGVLIEQRRYEGYCIDLIDRIANILGFKYEFEIVPDGAYGKYDAKTKSWNGLIRRLLDRVCRILICLTLQRFRSTEEFNKKNKKFLYIIAYLAGGRSRYLRSDNYV